MAFRVGQTSGAATATASEGNAITTIKDYLVGMAQNAAQLPTKAMAKVGSLTISQGPVGEATTEVAAATANAAAAQQTMEEKIRGAAVDGATSLANNIAELKEKGLNTLKDAVSPVTNALFGTDADSKVAADAQDLKDARYEEIMAAQKLSAEEFKRTYCDNSPYPECAACKFSHQIMELSVIDLYGMLMSIQDALNKMIEGDVGLGSMMIDCPGQLAALMGDQLGPLGKIVGPLAAGSMIATTAVTGALGAYENLVDTFKNTDIAYQLGKTLGMALQTGGGAGTFTKKMNNILSTLNISAKSVLGTPLSSALGITIPGITTGVATTSPFSHPLLSQIKGKNKNYSTGRSGDANYGWGELLTANAFRLTTGVYSPYEKVGMLGQGATLVSWVSDLITGYNSDTVEGESAARVSYNRGIQYPSVEAYYKADSVSSETGCLKELAVIQTSNPYSTPVIRPSSETVEHSVTFATVAEEGKTYYYQDGEDANGDPIYVPIEIEAGESLDTARAEHTNIFTIPDSDETPAIEPAPDKTEDVVGVAGKTYQYKDPVTGELVDMTDEIVVTKKEEVATYSDEAKGYGAYISVTEYDATKQYFIKDTSGNYIVATIEVQSVLENYRPGVTIKKMDEATGTLSEAKVIKLIEIYPHDPTLTEYIGLADLKEYTAGSEYYAFDSNTGTYVKVAISTQALFDSAISKFGTLKVGVEVTASTADEFYNRRAQYGALYKKIDSSISNEFDFSIASFEFGQLYKIETKAIESQDELERAIKNGLTVYAQTQLEISSAEEFAAYKEKYGTIVADMPDGDPIQIAGVNLSELPSPYNEVYEKATPEKELPKNGPLVFDDGTIYGASDSTEPSILQNGCSTERLVTKAHVPASEMAKLYGIGMSLDEIKMAYLLDHLDNSSELPKDCQDIEQIPTILDTLVDDTE